MSIIKYSVCIFTLCLYFSCKNAKEKQFNDYNLIKNELRRQGVLPFGNKDILAVLVSNTECIHCDILISTVLNDKTIMCHFPQENVCFIMPSIREIERKIFMDKFASDLSGKPTPPIIYNQNLFDTLENSLKNSVSGFFIITPDGNIKLAAGFTDKNVLDEIMAKL